MVVKFSKVVWIEGYICLFTYPLDSALLAALYTTNNKINMFKILLPLVNTCQIDSLLGILWKVNVIIVC